MTEERDRLAAHGIAPRKRLGQNFLLDARIPALIEGRAAWPAGAPILEVGPGAGALTAALLAAGHAVTAVEIDSDLVPLLEERFREALSARRFSLVREDVLALDLHEPPLAGALGAIGWAVPSGAAACATPAGTKSLWVTGNLPYGAGTAILDWTCRQSRCVAGGVFMLQREVAERILASPGGRQVGSLTHWIAARAHVRSLLRVGRSAFWPRPGVESMVIELTFPEPPPFRGDLAALDRLLRAAFGQRRKTLANALAHGLELEKGLAIATLRAAAIDPDARAESLSIEDFARLVVRLP